MPVADRAVLDVKLCAVAISPWIARDDRNAIFVDLDLCPAPQRFGQNSALQTELGRIIHVLIVAAAAFTKDGAERIHPIPGGLRHADQTCPLRVLFRCRWRHVHHLAWQHERSEDNLAIHAAQTFATIHELFNCEIQSHGNPKVSTPSERPGTGCPAFVCRSPTPARFLKPSGVLGHRKYVVCQPAKDCTDSCGFSGYESPHLLSNDSSRVT